MFHGISDKPQPGMGVLPKEWLQTTFLSTAVRRSCCAPHSHRISSQIAVIRFLQDGARIPTLAS